MKKILRLNEFINAKGLEQAKIANKPYPVVWANGKILFDPKPEDMMSDPAFFMAINMMIAPNEKKVVMRPMDDWSDIKIIRKAQQALADLEKSKIIDGKWECVIGDASNTRHSLGSTNVDDVIKFNAHFADVIPFAFHGTSSYYIDDIKKNGILPRSKTKVEPNWKFGYTQDSKKHIYMTIDYERAMYYANKSVEYIKSKGIESEPVVIMVKDLPTKYVTTDDDYKTNMGMLQLLQQLHHNKKASTGNHEYIQSIRNSSQFALTKPIKPDQITEIIYDEKENPS